MIEGIVSFDIISIYIVVHAIDMILLLQTVRSMSATDKTGKTVKQ